MKPPSEYHYLKERYKEKIQGFEKYLDKQGYEENTRRQYLNYTAYFLEWMKVSNQEGNQINYPELLSYIRHCQDRDDSIKLINRKLLSVRKYYEHLQLEGKTIKNPASGLYLKGKRVGVPNNLLDKKELKELYNQYQPYDLRTTRNKIILSLLINQAVTTDELHKLEPGHIKLKSGKIEIPGSKHSNGRILELKSNQIIELQEYLTETRPAILKAIRENMYWPGRKAEKPDFKLLDNRLFTSMNGGSSLKNSLKHLTVALQQLNKKVRDVRQIRQSVIAEWLKQEDVRKVQYKAGHKHVSTTERYQASNLEDLQEALNQHHPLK